MKRQAGEKVAIRKQISREDIRPEQVSDDQAVTMLRRLPPRVPPAALSTNLRVIASRERMRAENRRSSGITPWLDRTRLLVRDMLQPLALPAAGGVFSAVVLFSMWVVPTYPLLDKIATDIPTNLTTSVDIVQPLDGTGLTESVLVDVDVDDQGRMVDYQIVSGQSVVSDPAKRRRVESLLWFTRFTPATSFGMPMAGKARVRLMPSPWILNIQRADWPGIYVKG